MKTKTRNIYYSGTVSTNDAAHVDIQREGFITACLISVNLYVANNEQVVASVEFSSTIQSQTNDAMGVIAVCATGKEITTSGGFNTGQNISVAGIAIPVRIGDRIYLNTYATGSTSYAVAAILYVSEK